MTVVQGEPCLICTEWAWHPGAKRLVRLAGDCVCPYPHWTLSTPLPWWKSNIPERRTP